MFKLASNQNETELFFTIILPDSEGYSCPAGQTYSTCNPVCGTCRDQQDSTQYCVQSQDICVAGCACPGDQLLDDHGACVDVEQCTCYDAYDAHDDPIKPAGGVSERGCANW